MKKLIKGIIQNRTFGSGEIPKILKKSLTEEEIKYLQDKEKDFEIVITFTIEEL